MLSMPGPGNNPLRPSAELKVDLDIFGNPVRVTLTPIFVEAPDIDQDASDATEAGDDGPDILPMRPRAS